MKGTIITDAISTIAVIIIFIVLLFTVPKILAEIKDIIVSNSPKVMSRDLAGLATISAASPYTIEINYTNKEFSYDVEFSGRAVNVKYSDPVSTSSEESTSPMAVEISQQFQGVNHITIKRASGNIEVAGYEK
ncbi:hypothetical protein A3K63_01365 [Candidatus Micrarchaeota archaeon RBG_16_49_10]|nr:MAG: hypothetical protein A3K63_01365 [Candidatus Micrarchaeota archaeon RBG_16_49_10]